MKKNQHLYFALFLDFQNKNTTYQALNNVATYSPISHLIDFLESNWGSTAAQDLQDPQFSSADYAYNLSIFCPQNNNACFIFHPIQFYENISNFHHQYYKHLTPDLSFKITKENFIQVADLWKKYKKQRKPFLLFWTDHFGTTFLEFFIKDEQLKMRIDSLLSQNLIITNAEYAHVHNKTIST